VVRGKKGQLEKQYTLSRGLGLDALLTEKAEGLVGVVDLLDAGSGGLELLGKGLAAVGRTMSVFFFRLFIYLFIYLRASVSWMSLTPSFRSLITSVMGSLIPALRSCCWM